MQYFCFKKVESCFGFLHLAKVEKNGYEIPKINFNLQKNSLLHRWSQMEEILSIVNNYETSNNDYLLRAIEELKQMTIDVQESTHFQFLETQLEFLLISDNNIRYTKHLLIFAGELLCISPAAYKMIRNYRVLKLPREQLVRNLMTRNFVNTNLPLIFDVAQVSVKPEQRLVNILFDEVKLLKTTRLTGGHVIGYAINSPDAVATSAFCIEIVCHHGGPRFVIGIHPVSRINAKEVRDILIETIVELRKMDILPISFICDNCPLNQGVYRLLGGPGKVALCGINMYLIYDYVHILKNLRNNWITERTWELSFEEDGIEYLACWRDIQALYEEDKKMPLRLTKLTHTSVFPKPLQRQSVPLVCQVFHEKTIAAFRALKSTIDYQEGIIKFITLITNWFKMMNVKDKFSTIHLRDPFRAPWTLNCDNFSKLSAMCDVIDSCRWEGEDIDKKSLLNSLQMLLRLLQNLVLYLFTYHNFQYVLPAVFS